MSSVVTSPKTPERQAKPVECPWAPMRKVAGLNVVIPPQRRLDFDDAPRVVQNRAGRFGDQGQ
jgi:hypothetical protein